MRGDNWPAEPTVSMPGLRSPRAVPRGHGQASPAPLAFTVPLCQGNSFSYLPVQDLCYLIKSPFAMLPGASRSRASRCSCSSPWSIGCIL